MYTKHDLIQSENLILALKKAKYELDGMEILAFAETMKWVGRLNAAIKEDLAHQEELAKNPPVQDTKSRKQKEAKSE